MTSLSQQVDLKHHSREADFAQNLMSTICGQHRLDTIHKNCLDFHYDGIRLPNKKMAIGTISYGAHVAINISNLKAYSISLPIYGQQALTMGGARYCSNQNKGLIVSNNDDQDLIIDKDCKKLQVVIPERSMQMVLSSLLHTSIEKPIVFNPEMDLEAEQLLSVWWKNIAHFLQLKSQYMSFYGLQMLSEDYENFIIKGLLLSQAHNYSDALRNISDQSVPSYIRKVRDYIITHAQQEICADDLHHIAGVSKSKLYEEFQFFYQMSPMIFLKKYRLQQIYNILSTSASRQRISISTLAYEWGFNHLSRFSQEYKDEFGEKPSETKNKLL
ncbi:MULTISPECIES: AraC family transcriptional regulator [unclassified Acinetobacter]|uniref:AraC family transcriptional regulator n=1 Tax=unclassified Acinetobacter TaxID=196816 RepID=UPI0029344EE2|nr:MULTISPECIES: AraC family transcriptional regulator [unclassified Acinetobacter]WOE32489.1 AraC family transcriptional regulator [Acinetobacter sp. SAAs470]WOE37965.1 AraC family transcriptional regulator [Acinetobacter sp. SAAs474]